MFYVEDGTYINLFQGKEYTILENETLNIPDENKFIDML